ncbi:hypothetical protein SDC9_195939 [bioreactor metagenome]|uniref:Uncharacterized protein n=1 Tax=bioreactor metagenome TaxID=1076179 RepID=A0A645IBW9_9ZZZZ
MPDHLQAGTAARSFEDAMTGWFQRGLQHVADGGRVVDQQDGGHGQAPIGVAIIANCATHAGCLPSGEQHFGASSGFWPIVPCAALKSVFRRANPPVKGIMFSPNLPPAATCRS